MTIAVLSDIHGNQAAMEAVLSDIQRKLEVESFIFLGDLIDYGPHSNEVLDLVKRIDKPILCNIYGNHEDAVLNRRYDRLSSDRGRASAKYTLSLLSEESVDYIKTRMNPEACEVFSVAGKKCLAVHGSLNDHYWGSIKPGDVEGTYEGYDYVFSGHSHEPHFFELYYKADSPVTRNRKKTIFINPGSVGQPRNLNHHAQYAIVDTETEGVNMMKVSYDIEQEIKAFSDKVDVFYRDRLKTGV